MTLIKDMLNQLKFGYLGRMRNSGVCEMGTDD